MVCNICILYYNEIEKTCWLEKQRLFMPLSKFTFKVFEKEVVICL